ncbi:MAG: AIM24 family protein [Steroidobacteraceae bacterium]
MSRFSDLQEQARAARAAAVEAEQRAARLEQALRWWDRYLEPAKLAGVEAAKAKAALLQANARSWEQARDKVAPLIQQSPVAALQARSRRLEQDLAAVSGSLSPQQAALRAERERRVQQATALEQALARQRDRVAQDPRQRLIAEVMARLPLALTILAAVLLAPLLVKTCLYFAVAPIAERLPPTQVLAQDSGVVDAAATSAVSLPLDLASNEELLVRPDFLQSSSQHAIKRTQWLLNSRLPFASLAAGLVALTRIRPAPAGSTQVVVSSREDAFGEVATIDLPTGAAMVVLPRALAGVVKRTDQPLRISRHWQLATLQGWFTLRLRHLVFHGPCRLVIKGRRGVRAEQPQAAQPRIINQSATLAFSARLHGQVTRCETFMAYLRGHDQLFNDRFSGDSGTFVYELSPVDAQGRRVGRGLEGIVDAVLKAFGI